MLDEEHRWIFVSVCVNVCTLECVCVGKGNERQNHQ